MTTAQNPACFIEFEQSIAEFELPQRFNYPFLYDPHPLCRKAAEQIQAHLENHDWEHNFGLSLEKEGSDARAFGKMFGVLLVQNDNNEVGFLSAFSGKLGEKSQVDIFVPSIYDRLKVDGHFKTEEVNISACNVELDRLQKSEEYIYLTKQLKAVKKQAKEKQLQGRADVRDGKRNRRATRKKAIVELSDHAYQDLLNELAKESILSQFEYREQLRFWEREEQEAQDKFDAIHNRIIELKEERKRRSGQLQDFLFEQYNFLNAAGERRGVKAIFAETPLLKPPAGSGDCAAPKLLQYAFENGLKPLSMAEFWWGKSPNSEIRKHAHYYPSCRGKCFPILSHMLEGTEMEPDPTLLHSQTESQINVLHEDDHILVIEKPFNLLSVPGRNVMNSVQSRVRLKYPEITGPLIVHRLDMSTSGLMVLAKNQTAHKKLQAQFIQRTVRKRYSAVLEGIPQTTEGTIDLPLAGDYVNRPCQKVCREEGKAATTRWELASSISEKHKGRALIHFYPITGRTHQLRIHAAHQEGLNLPIVGDGLYGSRSDRLYLHADQLAFEHPITAQQMSFRSTPEFEADFTLPSD